MKTKKVFSTFDNKNPRKRYRTMKANWKSLVKKTALAILTMLVILIVAKILTRLIFLHWFYGPILNLLIDAFGPATAIMKITALVGSTIVVMILPTIIAIIIWGKRNKEVFFGLSAVFIILCGAIFYESQTVFFDSSTGEPVKYYCVTIDGVRFSNASGVDPKSGMKLQPVTKDLMKQYQIWEKYRQNESVPYFDTATGEPNFKYGEDGNGNITLYPTLYEFDPVSGKKLDFVDAQIMKECLEQTKKPSTSISRVFAATPQPTPPPRNVGWQKVSIPGNGDPVYIMTVYEGDEFEYISSQPFKTINVDSKDDVGESLHNKSSAPGEVRHFFFYNAPSHGSKLHLAALGSEDFEIKFRVNSR
jgi:hypothetical protein